MAFKPTYLYIKRHAITGKCYFGKTTASDPVKYPGSGKHWLYHVKKHGYEHIETLWFHLFTDQTECTRIALLFSEQQDIVNSDLWLNLKPENGIDGTLPGSTKSAETRARMSASMKGISKSLEHREKLSTANKGKKLPVEVCAKMSASRTGKSRNFSEDHCSNLSEAAKNRQTLTCPHCDSSGMSSNMRRYHFDNCKVLLNV